jgi:hypothetical protein
MDFNTDRYSDEELHAEFDRLFPHGFAGPDVFQELAPGGWARSPLVAVFRPSVDQLYEETLVMHRNLASLRRPDEPRPGLAEPTREEIAREYREHAVEPEAEVRELIGQCLWDVFSDGHEVVAAEDGRALDLGSFRYAGSVLADVANRQIGTTQYDYMSFYLGTSWVCQRADFTPIYELIFRRLRRRGLDWIYHFPRLYAVDFRALKETLDQEREPEWLNYSPSQALAREEEQTKHDRELAELRGSLDAGYREAVEEARSAPPPATVRAFQAVYGHLPRGWPPEA